MEENALQPSENTVAYSLPPITRPIISTTSSQPVSDHPFRRHLIILLIGLLITLGFGAFIFPSPCEDGFFIGLCAVAKIYALMLVGGLFVSWMVITTIVSFIYWRMKRQYLRLHWYIAVIIVLIALLFAWRVFDAKYGSQIREWQANRSLNNWACKQDNGVNTHNSGEIRQVVECSGGKIHGDYSRYKDNQLIYQAKYENGKLSGAEFRLNDDGTTMNTTFKAGNESGAEVYYDENGATSLYVSNDPNREHGAQIYYQKVENDLKYRIETFREESQTYLCSQPIEKRDESTSYSCNGLKIDGSYKEFSRNSNELYEEFNLIDGVLNGPAITYENGKVKSYAEYKNGKFHGKIYETGVYEGQYVDGLQEGIFKMYSYTGEVRSEVRFEKGKIVEVIQFNGP